MLKVFKISKISDITCVKARTLVSFKGFFGGKKEQTQPENDKVDEPDLISNDFDAVKENDEVARLVRVKAYTPPSDVEDRIKRICQEVFSKGFNEKLYQTTLLSNPNQKFEVLTKCMESFNHNISNTALNEIKNVSDVVTFFLTEQKDTSTLEDLRNRDDLPKNLHINLEYNRFNPETDKFFDGKDAYPGRNTLVPSLWYSKKYKPVIKKRDDWFEKS